MFNLSIFMENLLRNITGSLENYEAEKEDVVYGIAVFHIYWLIKHSPCLGKISVILMELADERKSRGVLFSPKKIDFGVRRIHAKSKSILNEETLNVQHIRHRVTLRFEVTLFNEYQQEAGGAHMVDCLLTWGDPAAVNIIL